PKHYQGWRGTLFACEADAKDMALIARAQSFTPKILLTKQATRNAVTKQLVSIASKLKRGDIFFLSYSGHGGQLPDVDGDEPDGKDETWCLYDGEFLDDEIFYYLGNFAEGARILVLSDSCHSGTVLKEALMLDAAQKTNPARYRCMPPGIPLRVYQANKEFYDGIGRDSKHKDAAKKIKASALLISGCQDNQLSQDGDFNGRFTGQLKLVWNGGKFQGNYLSFHKKITAQMPPDQTPNLFRVGVRSPSFEREEPFTIEEPVQERKR
ncbi:MAG TPA: caspase family protein, partial [Methyloceanibacter sp.]